MFLSLDSSSHSIHQVLKRKLTRGSHLIFTEWHGHQWLPRRTGGKQEWPPVPGCQVTLTKGTWSYWNAFHIQILKLVHGDIIFTFQKTKNIEELIAPKFLGNFISATLIYDLGWSAGRLIIGGSGTSNNWGTSEARGVCLYAPKWPYGGIRAERRQHFDQALSANVVWKPGLRNM